ncbi:MAG: AraC family transcriptional regulator [Reyranellaceae bacterium]
MSEIAFLRRFPALRTGNPDQVRDWLKPAFAIREFDMPRSERRFESRINHREFDSLSLTYARYGASFTARLVQNDFFVQGFPVTGSGEIRWNRYTVSVSTASGGVVGGPGAEARLSYDGSFSHLIVKFSPAVLTQKLSALIGRPIDPPLQMEGEATGNPNHLAGQARLVRFLAEEHDRQTGPLPSAALAEIEQAIIIAYLVAHPHNYSAWLQGTPSTVAPWQVRLAADYIEQNWDQPITIEALSHVAQTSARSLFLLFKRTYGVSPMVFVRQIRLRHARAALSNPAPDTSVTSVGYLCGFSKLSNFARFYYEAFGELPSDTLRSHR